jgi:hypothetical protein
MSVSGVAGEPREHPGVSVLIYDQARHLANMFATEPRVVRRMTFTNVARTSRRLIAARPLQSCQNCESGTAELRPILRSQLLGWRITCSLCGDPFQGELPSPFRQYRSVALLGEKLLHAEAERGVRTWASPTDIAYLLLMRRVPRPVPSAGGRRCWQAPG